MIMPELLRLENISVIHAPKGERIVQPTSFSLRAHQTLGIVGESGSGKSMLAKAIMGLLPQNFSVSGNLYFEGKNLTEQDEKSWQSIRGKEMSMIVQNAMGAFDPLKSLQTQFIETIRIHTHCDTNTAYTLACNALKKVNVLNPKEKLALRPHQLSGGQLQRMMIAIALALQPKLIIADEPTTALDAITQFGIIETFKSLVKEKQSSLIFITHDLGLVRSLADIIAVMHQGEIVEIGSADELWNSPKHPYTNYLLETRKRLTDRFCEVMNQGGKDAS